MNGFEATKEIRRRETDRHLPVIALTASAMKGDEQRCFNAGMDDFLAKPVSQEILSAKLAQWVTKFPSKPAVDSNASQPVRSVLDVSSLGPLKNLERLGADS
jgi:DNA-binding response OmpR family regulator